MPNINTNDPAYPTYTASGFVSKYFYIYSKTLSLEDLLRVTIKGDGGYDSTIIMPDGSFKLNNILESPNGYTIMISKAGYLTREIKNVKFSKPEITIGSKDSPLTLWRGDLNNDGSINMIDVYRMAIVYNSFYRNYDKLYDLNDDGALNMADIIVLALHFNQTSDSYPPVLIS